MRSELLLLAALTAVKLCLAQISRADLGLSGICRLGDGSAALPAGFHRSILQPLSSLTVDGQPHRPAQRLGGCQYVSASAEFDRLLGPQPTLYQIGDLQPFNWAFEGAAWLPGAAVQCMRGDACVPTHAARGEHALCMRMLSAGWCAVLTVAWPRAETDEVVVTGDFSSPEAGSRIYRVSLATGNTTEVPVHPPLVGANGLCSLKRQARGQVGPQGIRSRRTPAPSVPALCMCLQDLLPHRPARQTLNPARQCSWRWPCSPTLPAASPRGWCSWTPSQAPGTG